MSKKRYDYVPGLHTLMKYSGGNQTIAKFANKLVIKKLEREYLVVGSFGVKILSSEISKNEALKEIFGGLECKHG